MNNMITDNLNSQQQQAVTASPGNLLVLAGAGSGKTRVLVHRIAWLLENHGVSPLGILAVTFTNKAANEMRERIEQLVGPISQGMWVGTFHGLAHRFLRTHWRDANLPQTFQILDSEDQARLIRRVTKELSIDEDRWPTKQVQSFINNMKDEGLRAAQLANSNSPFIQTMQRIYLGYEQSCQRGGLVDFAELLLRTLELWQSHPNIAAHYQQRFQHILVDEFQDTNAIQYAWLRSLTGKNTHVMIVGDDDQSIYSWRGARVENIRRFQREFNDTQTIILEQNYRSTETILNAANKLIDHNGDRLGKNLWTKGNKGELISTYVAFNEIDEARFIVDRIQHWRQQDGTYQEVAILYRSNAQSRVLEEALINADIPYRIYGGMRFFERAEIKDALAYMRLLANHFDDAAFERVVNFPTRGIGERTMQIVRDQAKEKQLSLFDASQNIIEKNILSTRANQALNGFLSLVDELKLSSENLALDELCDHVLQHSGLLSHYQQLKGEKGLAKVENLEELVTACRQFSDGDDDDNDDSQALSPLTAFLSHAALEAGEGQTTDSHHCVQLMTLHSAKGLEFPLVFLAGVEEGLFPHQMSIDEPDRLEEERRLCYVGITRAMQKLYISYAERRRLYGQEKYHAPSRFIMELPTECLQEVRARASIVRPSHSHHSYSNYSHSNHSHPRSSQTTKKSFVFNQADQQHDGLKIGQYVRHGKFGDGVITKFEGQGTQARVQVHFKRVGSKWLVMSYAKLEKV